ncbi:hypothetical protein [Azotobacter chroococcum]|nr:hypothetical protein [Azotobacter chroococcum]
MKVREGACVDGGQAGEAVDERLEVVFTSSETVPPDKTLLIQ